MRLSLKKQGVLLFPAHPAKRGLVDSQFTYLLKMTYRCWALREHYCFYRCQTCSLFLRACLRGNSFANRCDSCHHRSCLQKVWIQNGDPTAENDRHSKCETRYRPLARSHLITGEDRTQRRECVAVITLSTSLGRV